LDPIRPRSHLDRKTRRPPLLIRTLDPSLTDFQFIGVSEYLQDFVARFDAPLLDVLHIAFLLSAHIRHPATRLFFTRTPQFKARGQAHATFSGCGEFVTVPVDSLMKTVATSLFRRCSSCSFDSPLGSSSHPRLRFQLLYVLLVLGTPCISVRDRYMVNEFACNLSFVKSRS
jgi:hypothetical protein